MQAVLFDPQQALAYLATVPEPTPQTDDQLVLRVRAAAIKHLDKGQARGTHYASHRAAAPAGRPIGGDAVGTLPDGRRVYALATAGTGTVAEYALVDGHRLVPVPEQLDDATAAALPNAVIGAGMALRFRAGLRADETVLINGATGVTGRLAVQLAKRYGAGRVIATGRNPGALRALQALGADEVVSLQQPEEELVAQLRALHASTPFDCILDYLWGRPAELLLQALRGTGGFSHRVRFVSVGTMTGDTLALSGATLRSCDLHLTGSGLGSWSRPELGQLFTSLLPEAFRWAAEGSLHVATATVPLARVAEAWEAPIASGQRLVVVVE